MKLAFGLGPLLAEILLLLSSDQAAHWEKIFPVMRQLLCLRESVISIVLEVLLSFLSVHLSFHQLLYHLVLRPGWVRAVVRFQKTMLQISLGSLVAFDINCIPT